MRDGLRRLLPRIILDYLDRRDPPIQKTPLEEVLASMSEAVFITDSAGIIEYANPAFQALSGYGIAEVIGQSTRFLKSGSHPPEFFTEMFDTIRAGRPWRGEVINRHKDGRLYTVELSIFPIGGREGGETRFLAIQRDVTGQKQLLEDLQARLTLSEQKYRSIFENAVEGLYQTTIDGSLLTANPALYKMFGYDSLGDLQRTKVVCLYPNPADRDSYVSKLLTEGTFRAEDVVLKRKDGTYITVQETARVVRDSAGLPIYFEGALVDVTTKKAMERQAFVTQKMESLAQLAGGIAHDFNNLLTGVLGYSSLLLRRIDHEHEFYASILQIRKTAERAADLTQKLLSISRQSVVQPVRTSLNTILREARAVLEGSIESRVTLEFKLEENLPEVDADETQIRTVVLNLAANALDAMPGGGRLTVESGVRTLAADPLRTRPWAREGAFAFLRLSDTGGGMDETTLRHVFEPFFTTKYDVPARGLGLALVYGIVKNHNGVVEVESKPGAGSSFTVYLPVAHRPAIAAREVAECESGKGILFIDDEQVVRDLAQTVLTTEGYTVFMAAHGEQALRLYAGHRNEIGLVILDMTMPGMNGRQVMSELLAQDPRCRVLLSSGFSMDASIDELLRTGAVGFLPKPYVPQVLVERVHHLLAGRG